MDITIESAIDLNQSQKKSLQKKLNTFLGNSATFNYQNDPTLIGGLRISTGKQVVDLSLKARLNQLQSDIST